MIYDDAKQTEPVSEAPGRTPQLKRLLSSYLVIALIIVCVVGTALLLAAWGGLVAGQNARDAQATQTAVVEMDVQFEMGLADLEAGQYRLAAQRFTWILERNPGYPGAAEKLAEARRLLENGVSANSTPIPPSQADTNEERFAEARSLYNEKQWEAAIDRLEMLQARAPDYQPEQVEEMLYESLRQLGLRYIRTDERLEEGIVLLDRAALIRPLDDISEGERLIASLYVTGKTYWALNWPIVIQNFSEIYAVAPNYRDVESRLLEAYITYGDQLWLGGTPCDSVSLYQSAARIRNDAQIQDKIVGAIDACENPTPTPTPTGGAPGEETPPPPGEPVEGGEAPPPSQEG